MILLVLIVSIVFAIYIVINAPDFDPENFNSDTFINAEEEANSDYDFKLSGIEDLVGGGELTIGELAEMIKTQQFDLIQLKKENQLLKSKLIKAAQQGFKI